MSPQEFLLLMNKWKQIQEILEFVKTYEANQRQITETTQSIIISIDFVFMQGKDVFDINNLSQHPRKQAISLF